MKWKLFFLLMSLGLIGIYLMCYIALPQLLMGKTIPLPLEQIQLVSFSQSTVFLAVACTVGIGLHEKVQLDSPIIRGVLTHHLDAVSFKPILIWSISGGVFGSIILIGYHYLFLQLTQFLALTETSSSLPIVVRIFYGGITEEILLRWGVMTFLVWCLVKLFVKNFTSIPNLYYWIAILLSSFIFATLHLPILFSTITTPSSILIFMVIIGNSLFGLIAGYLYWKHGLESAMIAHILAHFIAFLVVG